MFYSPDGREKPGAKKLIFPARKQRPTEARFMVWKNSFFSKDL
jgi:hypothetical protein